MVKQCTKKGAAIKSLMEKGRTISQISKALGISLKTIYYYRKRPEKLDIKLSSKCLSHTLMKYLSLLQIKYTREMPGAIIASKINEILKKDNVLNKNGKILTITKSQINRILRKKYGKPVQVKKFFYLTEEQKEKRMKFCKNILETGIDGKDIFFTNETKIDKAPYRAGETIRFS